MQCNTTSGIPFYWVMQICSECKQNKSSFDISRNFQGLALIQYTQGVYQGYHGMSYIKSNPHQWTIWSSKGFAICPLIVEKSGV